MWEKYHPIETIGSEGGTIIFDEEYQQTCRITLEKCRDYYAITCGVYGDMVHTAFCGEENYVETYQSIKDELKNFVDNIYQKDSLEGRSDFYRYLVEKYLD